MFEGLDGLIRRQIEESRLTGLSIALVRGDEIVWSRGYGCADLASGDPVTPATVFSIQSVTKPVVATALMQGHERGRFQLDDPVAPHLAPVALENEWEAAAPVTFRRLLSHTAGFPVDLGGAAAGTGSPATLDEFVARVAKTVRPPGDDIVYANYGYDMIGLLIERFAGKPFEAALHEQVLDPLEMRSTYVGRPAEGVRPARGYYLSAIDGEHHAVPHDYEQPGAFPRPAGVLLAPAEDVARFLIAHMNGGLYRGWRVLEPDTVAEMHHVQARHGSAGNGMGLGFKVDERPNGRFVYHGGDGVGFTAFIGACPERRAGVVLLMNMGRAHTARSVIGDAALRCLIDEVQVPARKPSPQESKRLAGRYVSNFWGYIADCVIADGVPVLSVVSGGLLASEEQPSVLQETGNGCYRASGGFFDGFELAFDFDSCRQATSFAGGLYAFRFDRRGDVPVAGPVDEGADVAGGWTGTATSPMGPVPLGLAIAKGAATVSALSAHDAPVRAFEAGRGRVEGDFDVSVPGLGDFRLFLRLHASEGKLRGNAYARGAFGEVAMPVELERC